MPRISRSRNPQHWRARAEEARTVAESLGDLNCKRMMLEVAEDYERLAQRAEEREKRPRSAMTLNETPAT